MLHRDADSRRTTADAAISAPSPLLVPLAHRMEGSGVRAGPGRGARTTLMPRLSAAPAVFSLSPRRGKACWLRFESGAEATAVQTLRDDGRRRVRAPASGVRRLQRRCLAPPPAALSPDSLLRSARRSATG
jgi:hypothetical protein